MAWPKEKRKGERKKAGLALVTSYKKEFRGFPSGAVVENLPANAGDTSLSPGPGRSHMQRSN